MPEPTNISAELIQQAALLFQQRGYDEVTKAELAAAAGITVEEVPEKILLALAIYRDLTRQLLDAVLPAGTLADRYGLLLEMRVMQYQQNEEAVSTLFATLMRRSSSTLQPTDLSSGKHDPLYQVFVQVIAAASDAPSSADDSENLAMLLVSFHFLVTLFWLYDRTADHQATNLLIDFLRDVFKVMRPLMIMPIFGKAMTKLAHIMMLVFGGARLNLS